MADFDHSGHEVNIIAMVRRLNKLLGPFLLVLITCLNLKRKSAPPEIARSNFQGGAIKNVLIAGDRGRSLLLKKFGRQGGVVWFALVDNPPYFADCSLCESHVMRAMKV